MNKIFPYSKRMTVLLFLLIGLSVMGMAKDGPLTDLKKKQKINALYQKFRLKSFPAVSEISAPELLRKIQKNTVVLVDVRTEKERAVSMLPGAISKKDFEKNVRKYKDLQIVIYCTIGYRSGKYTKKLQKKGIAAFNLAGGVLAWAHAGGPFLKEKNKTLQVHIYNKKWNLLPAGYEPVW